MSETPSSTLVIRERLIIPVSLYESAGATGVSQRIEAARQRVAADARSQGIEQPVVRTFYSAHVKGAAISFPIRDIGRSTWQEILPGAPLEVNLVCEGGWLVADNTAVQPLVKADATVDWGQDCSMGGPPIYTDYP